MALLYNLVQNPLPWIKLFTYLAFIFLSAYSAVGAIKVVGM